jgi:NAD(P)-dependent dehydrogenase (short-subunit alcohol dehydrogenase family)
MGCRTDARYEIAKATILSRLQPEERRGKLNFVQVDTSTVRTSQLAAYDILARADINRLDIFIANAGRGSTVGPLNEDGVEPFMATNCLGHLALLQLLLPLIVETSRTSQSSSRIVFVSSVAHQWASLIYPFSIRPTFSSWGDVNDTRLGERGLYSRSKVSHTEGSLITCSDLPQIAGTDTDNEASRS